MPTALFPGCAARDLYPKAMNSWSRLLGLILEDFDYINRRICCGMPFFLSGNIEDARECGLRLSELLNRYDVLITGCPSCYRMFTRFYPSVLNIKLGPKVYHLVQFIYEKIRLGEVKITKPVDLCVTYHDPCELARHEDIIDEPRRILEAILGLKFIELELNKKNSTCCGGGGLMRALLPKLSQEIAINKIVNEIIPLGVSAIITACPFCEYVLNDAVHILGNEKTIKILDISEIILMAMGDI